MGDMSRCEHGGFYGYCNLCNPNWEAEMAAEDLHKEPDVYDVTEPVAFHVWGGG